MFTLILGVKKKNCSFLLRRIFLLTDFLDFLKVLSPFLSFISKTLPATSACFKYIFTFLLDISQICRFFACLSFLFAFDQKMCFLFLCVNSCLFFGHSHFLFSFLNFCFSLVSLSCCPFWMYLFFEESLWFDYPFSVSSLSSPFTYFPVISKRTRFSD